MILNATGSQKIWGIHSYVRQNKLHAKRRNRKKKMLYNDKRDNSSRRHNSKICKPNIRAPKCLTQVLTESKGETDSSTVVVGDTSRLHQWIDHPVRSPTRK